MTFLTKILHFLLIFLSCQSLYGLQSKRTVHLNDIIRRPPDSIQRGGGGGENGYRLLTSQECLSISHLWRKKLGFLDSNIKIELYEMISIIERGSEIMPGKEPQRKELVAFGEFQDGVIVCVCMGYLFKCRCPWDLYVMTMAQMLQDPHIEENMVAFIKDICLEHACVPDYSYLDRWDSFADRKWMKSPRKLAEEKMTDTEGSISTYYSNCNKAPAVVLDNHAVDYLGPYWYKFRIPNRSLPENQRAILYFRQRSENIRDEFEIRFLPPVTGVSSGRGTVGAAIIIDIDDDESFVKYKCSNIVIGSVKIVADEILSRINHPEEHCAIEDISKERTNLSVDYMTGREILSKLRDDYRRANVKNGQS